MAKKTYPNLEDRDGIYYYNFRRNGQRYCASTHTGNVSEAQRIVREMITKAEAGEMVRAPGHTPGAAPKRYASTREYADKKISEQLDRGTSPKDSKYGLALQWKRLCELFPTVDLITDDSVSAYFHEQLRNGYKRESVKRDIPLLRNCVNEWGRRLHPELQVVLWKVPRQRRPEELSEQAGEAKDPAFLRRWAAALHARAQAQALVAMNTGLRAFELRRVKPSWVKPLKGKAIGHMLHVPAPSTKGGRPRKIGLTPLVAELILEHFPIPNDFKKHFNGVAKRLGHGDTVHLRDLRHTFNVEVGEHEPVHVELVMGHHRSGGSSNDRYRHQTDDGCVRVAEVAARIFLAPPEG